MSNKLQFLIFSVIMLHFNTLIAQNVSLFNQFNGRYDFTFVGNTMNIAENGANDQCLILTSSSENYVMNAGDTIESAYLYWAGSGTGDLNVNLNGTPIDAQRYFTLTLSTTGKPFFSAFADVTTLVQSTQGGTYTLSELDVSNVLNPLDYCNNGTNFAGWALLIVYKNNALPLNQLNVYDGLQNVPTQLTINLNSLNVIDNADAKIGFIAWEGDRNIQVNETLTINGNVISNPPLNPANNAFNGTNSITGSTTMFNMDLDIYSIENNINIGDTSAIIQLTSGQDFVMINTVVTKLNSQLADATVTINSINRECNSRTIEAAFTVNNFNSTNELPAGTPIAVYANGILIEVIETPSIIPINGSWSSQITFNLPENFPTTFDLQFIADNNGTGIGIVTELIENNNSDSETVTLLFLPNFNALEDIIVCNEGFNSGTFNFSNYQETVKTNSTDIVKFFETLQDAQNSTNEIFTISNYQAAQTPKEIFIRIDGPNCYSITSFNLITKNCLPTIYNFVSANNDSVNDTFYIEGLRNIFLDFELNIYNRWGTLVWTGDNNSQEWDGFSNKGIRFDTSISPKGTYFYILNLNDKDYPKPIVGWLYLEK